MRVLSIIDSLAVGGAEQSLSTLTPHLVQRGIDLHVGHLIDERGVGPELLAGGAHLHSLAGRGGRLFALRRTMATIRRIRPDLVHTTLFEADLVGRTAARLVGVPVVSSFVTEAYGPEHVHNPEYRWWKVRAAQIADAVTARFVTRFHAVSASSAAVMSRRLRLTGIDVDIVPRTRDVAKLGSCGSERRHRVRATLGLAEQTPLVVAAGRHYNLKGLDILVRAFADVVRMVPEAQLIIAGRRGPATPDLERLAIEGGVEQSVVLVGYRKDVPDLMCAGDLFVLPSRAEGSPGVLLEAMALGIPTVASDIPSVREVAGDEVETVALIPVDDPSAMAAEIVALLEDRERAFAMAEAARARFTAAFAVDTVAEQTIALYERCLNGERVSAPLG